MIKAVIFDLDGVLIVTEFETFRFYQDYLKKHGISLKDEDFHYKAGRKSVDFFNNVLTPEQQQQVDLPGLIRLKRDLFNENIEKFVSKMEGGVELLQYLTREKYLLALASQNEKRMIDTAVNWLGIRDYFRIILSLEDIREKKPDPEIYFLAASKLGVSPKECVVIEDSRDGVGAVKNAGMQCIGIFHDYMPAGTLDKADVVVKRLTEIDRGLISKLEKTQSLF